MLHVRSELREGGAKPSEVIASAPEQNKSPMHPAVAMQRQSSVARWLIEGATMFTVAALSLLLLLYVGFGDGKRTYELIHIEKLTAQGLFIQNSVEKFVRDGLPLKQYAGF